MESEEFDPTVLVQKFKAWDNDCTLYADDCDASSFPSRIEFVENRFMAGRTSFPLVGSRCRPWIAEFINRTHGNRPHLEIW